MMDYIKLDVEEIDKIKIFADATLIILEAYDQMLDDTRIDETIRNEYRLKVQL